MFLFIFFSNHILFYRKVDTPGFFDSFSIVGAFLEHMVKLIFSLQDKEQLLLKSSSDQKATVSREIELPSYGVVGDVVNDIANTVLNTATVWMYQ